MRKPNHGFIISLHGTVDLWVSLRENTPDGFRFWVINGAWKGRWWDSDDLLTNGGFTVSGETSSKARPSTFRYAPPGMPDFSDRQYNEAIRWMQQYLNNGART